MVRKFPLVALAGALMMAVSPALAAEMVDVPVIGQVDMDPLNIMSPAPAAAPAAAAPMKKMHHHKMMHHKMMHKKMMKKKM